MSSVTWLHISDLHWRESEAYDANVVAGALLRDLAERTERISPELGRIDFIFVTGDVAFASRPEEYILAQKFFDELLRVTDVPKSRLFIVPGNHDVDRGAITDDARAATATLGAQGAISRLLGDEKKHSSVMQRFHHYEAFVNGCLEKYTPFDARHYFYAEARKHDGKRIVILGLNSAWASSSDADRLHLCLGEPQVRDALAQVRHADLCIALLHHPFDWLLDSDRDVCEPLLLRSCNFVLHGHLHRTDLIYQQSPGSRAMVIGAGACYETRKHPNAYNLVRFDVDSGKGTIYLRVYSDREGGFWTKDLLSYQDAPGEYTFNLSLETAPAPSPEPSGDVAPSDVSVPQVLVVAFEAAPAVRPKRSGLDRWWAGRGYRSNPFAWSNAANVGDDFPELFQAWHIDPNTDAGLGGLGPTPTLDAISSEESGLVLAYAPAGGGKTFYRRLAARLVEERAGAERVVEISDVVAQVSDSDQVTAQALALCVLDHVCRMLSVELPLPSAASAARIFGKCDEVITAARGSQEATRVYVFVDDLHQLFGEESSKAEQNTQALKAVLDFCKVAAERGGETLALRLFIPEGLREPIQRGLGERRRQRIEECTISWSVEHCQSVIERRLENFWEGGAGAGVAHLSRLLTPDALEEFLDWLRRQEGAVSPRCVVRVFDGLAWYAYGHGVTTGRIGVELWNAFVSSGESKARCVQDISYPLRRRWFRLPRWPWLVLPLLLASLGAVLAASASVRDFLGAVLLGLAGLVVAAAAWLAATMDLVQGFILLAVLLGSAAFMCWCLVESKRSGRPPGLRECLRRIWQLVRPRLPGDS